MDQQREDSHSTGIPYGQLKCINRSCKSGENLLEAITLTCNYFKVEYKPGKEVCRNCLIECFTHYKQLKNNSLDGKCILDNSFPTYESPCVIESSSEDEDPRPSSSRGPVDETAESLIKNAVDKLFHNNKTPISNQVSLCNEHTKKIEKEWFAMADTIDNMFDKLQERVVSLRRKIYEQYQPKIELIPFLDLPPDGPLGLPEANNKRSIEEKDDQNKRVKTDDTRYQEEDKDKEEVQVTSDSTICIIPPDLPHEGPVEYTTLKPGYKVFAMLSNLIHPWTIGKIKSVVNNDYMHIKFEGDEKLLTVKEIAYYTKNTVRFPIGSRVIAKFRKDVKKLSSTDPFYVGVIGEPPKLLNKFRYLIFFDDGSVQYRHHKDIRLIVHKTNKVWNDVHQDSIEFLKTYLKNYPERQMVKLTSQNLVRAAYQNKWQLAKVIEVDASLVRLYFTDNRIHEWLYRGSSRLWKIYEKQCKSEKGIRLRQSGLAYLNKPFVEFTSFEEPEIYKSITRKSPSKVSTSSRDKSSKRISQKDDLYKSSIIKLHESVPQPKKFVLHDCNHSCIDWIKYNYNRAKQISMLAIPLHFGFVRCLGYFNGSQKCVIYKTPCGLLVRNIKEMFDYLIVTSSKMTIDQFDFNSWVKPLSGFKVLECKMYLPDISVGKELKGISCVNTIDHKLPPPMEYMTSRQAMPGVNINVDSSYLCGCDCTDNCQDKSKCACWQLTIEGQKILPNIYKDPNIGYGYRRLPECVLTGIYECNKTCKCSSSCLNRVVQLPLSQKLQLFLTEKKGWGVRCLNDIPQGSFICIYVGCLLTETDANEGGKNYGDEYLAELDFIEVVEKIKEDYESDVPLSDESSDSDDDTRMSGSSYQSRSSASEMSLRLRKNKKPKNDTKTKKDGRQTPSKLNSNYMKYHSEPSKSMRDYFGNNESVYIMDAKTSGNIGRYFNHSCSPNTYVQNVFVDTHDLRFPWVSFFALHYIPAGNELTWDYSYDIGSVPGKVMKCHCGSIYCRGRLL